jgi:valyl-tRNA synthetase
MDLRPQAHDIVTFWLFNTLVKSQLSTKKNPWKNVMISGWALDPHGKKMSKSKGNVIAPQLMIEKYSADALRFWAAGSKLGDDLPFMEKDLVTGKKMATKMWNSSKFAIMHLENFEHGNYELEVMDKWILTKLQKLIKNCTTSMDAYEYSKAKQEIELFFWNVYCNNYLEVVKDRLYNPDKYDVGAKESAQYTLYEATLNVLKLVAPIMPYITEEIYHLYFAAKEKKKSIHASSWPAFDQNLIDEDAERAGDYLVQILGAVRKFKSEKAMSLKQELSSLVIECSPEIRELLEKVYDDLKAVTLAKDIDFGTADTEIESGIKIKVLL